MARDPSLERSIEQLTSAFDRLSQRLEAIEASPGPGSDRLLRHSQRYLPFYALLAIFAVFLVLLPTRSKDNATQAGNLTPATQQGFDSGTFSTDPGDTGTSGVSADSPAGSAGGPVSTSGSVEPGGPVGAVPAGPSAGDIDPLAWKLTGKTIAGFDCAPNVRQIPWSAYAAPCHPKFTGKNPGATYRGVTDKEITIVIRRFPETANSQAVEAAVVAAGFASTEVARAVNEEFRKYFNKVYELWGRKVKWVIYESQFGDSTAEAQSKGKEGACADANYIVNELKAFGVTGDTGGSNVFAECAAARGLMTFWAAPYFPERWYERHHPFAWHTVTDCERISEQVAEYIGKRLANKPAKWAKGLERNMPRKFAVYVPNNDEYQFCVNLYENRARNYGVTTTSRYNYTLDVSRFPDEAAKAAVQFKASGATTLVMACDPISMIFLTQSARSQNWFPEWFNIGVALNDTDNFPRLWDPEEVRGSLFGMSQLGSTEKILGPKGEPVITYKRATGTDIPEGTDGGYNNLVFVFNALQAAGPHLTPKAIGDAIYRLPPGGAPRFDLGYISYRDAPDGTPGGTDHSGIDDSREIYWDHEATGYDGERGTYIETYGGKRFRNGQWPKEDPPIYP